MIEREEIKQTFWTKKEIKDEIVGKRLVHLLIERDDELKPTYWYGGKYENKKIDNETSKLFTEALLDDTAINGFLQYTQYAFTNNDRKKRDFNFDIHFGGAGCEYNIFSFRISHEYFTNQERLDKFLTLSREIILLLNPFYGKIHDIGDGLKGVSNNQTYGVLEKVPRIFWGNYFGDIYIERIGEEKLLSCKAYKIEKIGNGIYIQLTKSPLEFETNECKQARKKLESYIGKQHFGYKEHKTINELFKR